MRRLAAILVPAAAAAFLLASCSGMMPSAPIDLPAWSPGPGLPAGLADGILRWDGDCVRLETEVGPDWVVIWPQGTRLREDLVPPIVVDGQDHVIGTLGDQVRLAGAAYPAGSWTAVHDRLVEDVPRACRDEAFWLGVPLGP